LILFPRKAGQHKKDDATKEDVASANKAEHIKLTSVALPIVHASSEIKEIKKSELPKAVEGGVYRKLRDSRSEARYSGRREKRAKDKAAEADAAKK
jgi:large subunit ribosomal protein L13e